MQTLGFIGEHALLHETVDERTSAWPASRTFRIELRAEHLTRAIDLLAHRVVVLGASRSCDR